MTAGVFAESRSRVDLGLDGKTSILGSRHFHPTGVFTGVRNESRYGFETLRGRYWRDMPAEIVGVVDDNKFFGHSIRDKSILPHKAPSLRKAFKMAPC